MRNCAPVCRTAPRGCSVVPSAHSTDAIDAYAASLLPHQNQPQSLHRLHPRDPSAAGIAGGPLPPPLLSGSGNAISGSFRRPAAAHPSHPESRTPRTPGGPPPCGWESSPPPSRPPPATLPPPRAGSRVCSAAACTAYAMRLRVCQGKSCVPKAGCGRKINMVDADTEVADHLEVRKAVHDRSVDDGVAVKKESLDFLQRFLRPFLQEAPGSRAAVRCKQLFNKGGKRHIH